MDFIRTTDTRGLEFCLMGIQGERERRQRDRLDKLAVISFAHEQAIGQASEAVLSTSGEQLSSAVRFGRY